jgi:integrase
MFLSVNHGWTPENKAAAWFKNCPAGINELGKWLKDSAQKAGLDTKRLKITNHSARSSAVTMLASSGIGEQELIKITGHSSGASHQAVLAAQ